MKKLYTTLLLAVLGFTATAQTVVYVNDNANGNNDGTSWTDAYTDLNVALTNTANDTGFTGAQIWIAEGFYTRISQNESFNVDNDVLLYGGFAGTESNISSRDIENHPTIISGDVDWNDTGAPSSSNSSMGGNAANVFKVISPNRALFNGLIIEHAYSTSASGGGINIISNSLHNLEITNCIIRENVSMNRAGVMYYAYQGSSFYLFNNRIEDNVNTDAGSAYTIEFRAANTSYLYGEVHFVNNLFKNNTTESQYQAATCARFTVFAGSDVDFYLINNTFIDNPQTSTGTNVPLIGYEFGGTGSEINAYVNNNIFYNNPGVNNIFGVTQGTGNNGSFNLYSAQSNQNVQDFPDNHNMQNTHIVSSSPFVNYPNGDYTPIAAYSTTGEASYYSSLNLIYTYPGQNYPTTDLAGNPRFNTSNQISIGAFQPSAVTSINNIQNSNNLHCYPNPTKDIVTIDLGEEFLNTNIVVTDITGKLITEFNNISSTKTKVNLAGNNSGFYLIKVYQNNELTKTLKVVKE